MLKHITVILPNRPLEFHKVAEILKNVGVNILAYHIVDTGRGGFVQLVCDPHETALSALGAEYKLFARESEVIGVRIRNIPGQLAKVLEIVGQRHLNVRSSYLAIGSDESPVILLEFDAEETETARNLIM